MTIENIQYLRLDQEIFKKNEILNFIPKSSFKVKKQLEETSNNKTIQNLQELLKKENVIFYGPKGAGKTYLIDRYVQCEYFNCADFIDPKEWKTEKNLKSAFDRKSSLIVLDDLQELFTAKKQFIPNLLISLLERCENPILAVTSTISAIPHVFLTEFFKSKLHYPIPDFEGRKRFLESVLSKDSENVKVYTPQFLSSVAERTNGYSIADLIGLVRQSVLLSTEEQLTCTNIIDACAICRPSNLVGLTTQLPPISFDDLFGISNIISDIKNLIVQPILGQDEYLKYGIMPPKGLLIHGPSGCGKTALAMATINALGLACIAIDGPAIRSQIVGQSEQQIANLFKKARSAAPCILFIDQLDMILSKRGNSSTSHGSADRIITTFLTEMDGVLGKETLESVFIVAVAQNMNDIDAAIIRPGRLDIHIPIPKPDSESRKSMISGILERMPNTLTHMDRMALVSKSEGFSTGKVDSMCRAAAMNAIRSNFEKVGIECFD